MTYATHDETGAPGTTNVVKPVYHVGWLASRLGMRVASPLAPVEAKGQATAGGGRRRGAGRRLRPGERRRSTAASRHACGRPRTSPS